MNVESQPPSLSYLGPHILIIDDDARLRALLLRYLAEEGFVVSAVACATEAEIALDLFKPDLMILDVMMPDISGFDFLSKQTRNVPCLFLSAMGDPKHRIQGLEKGAQDYLAKPFDPRELLLRIQTILARTTSRQTSPSLQLGVFRFTEETCCLEKGTTQYFLTGTELNLLKALIASLNKPVKREHLATLLKDPSNLRTVDVQVNRLRQRLEEDPKNPKVLLTVRGQGYVLKGTQAL